MRGALLPSPREIRSDATEGERLEMRVRSALADNPCPLGDHVSVKIQDGIATLQGFVFDDWDLRNALRVTRTVPGVNRVVNDLEIRIGGE